jgi:hypothetical protein
MTVGVSSLRCSDVSFGTTAVADGPGGQSGLWDSHPSGHQGAGCRDGPKGLGTALDEGLRGRHEAPRPLAIITTCRPESLVSGRTSALASYGHVSHIGWGR